MYTSQKYWDQDSRLRCYQNNVLTAYKLAVNPLSLSVTQVDWNLIMICYTTFLLLRNILLYKSIKVGTVDKYKLAAKDNFLDNNQWDQ